MIDTFLKMVNLFITKKVKDLHLLVESKVDNSLYYLHVPTEFSVQFTTYDDAVSGINTINLTSRSAGSSTLTATKERNILDSIVVTNQGSGYSNRRAVVSSVFYPPVDFTTTDEIKSGINTANHYVFFKNHGFENGDLVEYNSIPN